MITATTEASIVVLPEEVKVVPLVLLGSVSEESGNGEPSSTIWVPK